MSFISRKTDRNNQLVLGTKEKLHSIGSSKI